MRSLTILVVAVTLTTSARFAQHTFAGPPALSAHQQTIRDEVKAGLESVDQALVDARATFDGGDVNGATSAYSTAVRNYNNHVRRLGQLPSDEPSVAELRKQAETLGAKLKETAAALRAAPANKPAAKPTEKPADKTTPSAASSSLAYPDREKLKNAQFHLKDVESRVDRINELVAGKLDAEAILEAQNHMTYVNQRLGYAMDGLKALPADNADVATALKSHAAITEKMSSAKAAMDKAAPEANKQIAALGEQMNNDLAMVDSWSKSLGDPQNFFNHRPDDAIAVVGQLPQMRNAMSDMLKRWTTRATEKPNDQTAAEMVRKSKYVDGQLTQFEQYTKGLATSLPQQIAADLAEVNEMITVAEKEKRPAYFSKDGGIAHKLKEVEARVKLLRAIDSTAADRSAESLHASRNDVARAQKSLASEIIAGNKKLIEKYRGPDVEDLRAQVIASWREDHPKDEVLAVVFNTEGWARTTRWDWSKTSQTFSKVDYDYIQPKLFYKLNDKHAVEQPVDIYKDYMKDGRIAIKPWDREEDPPVQRLYLLENVK